MHSWINSTSHLESNCLYGTASNEFKTNITQKRKKEKKKKPMKQPWILLSRKILFTPKLGNLILPFSETFIHPNKNVLVFHECWIECSSITWNDYLVIGWTPPLCPFSFNLPPMYACWPQTTIRVSKSHHHLLFWLNVFGMIKANHVWCHGGPSFYD